MHTEGLLKKPPSRRLYVKEIKEKRAKGMCFICDKKYFQRHNFKSSKHLYLVEISADVEGNDMEV